jgi:hypothetical protein
MKNIKTILIGVGILLVVVLGAFGYQYLSAKNGPVKSISGFIGGEKINFFEDPQVISILEKDYRIQADVSKAGSLDMIRADLSNKDFLFPSSQTALELYTKTIGSTYKDEIVFNTPIVLYSHKIVADAFVNNGLATYENGVYMIDMAKLVKMMDENKTWTEIGLPQLYGPIVVDTTDPAKSNSGNMFAGLVANMLNDGQVVTDQQLPQIQPRLTKIFDKLGYMETSSSDLFNQFLKTGLGAKPIVAGYENQLLEFSKAQPEAWKQVKDDIVIMYPTPTVWSTHIFISLNDNGVELMKALEDERLQKIAWQEHGFRTGVNGSTTQGSTFDVPGVQENITQVVQMPGSSVMDAIIKAFE